MVFSCNIESERYEYKYAAAQMSISNIYRCTFDINNSHNNRHTHNYYEVCFVSSGKGSFYCGDNCIQISKDTIFVGPPNIAHEIVLLGQEPLNIYFFTFAIHSYKTTKTADDKSIIILNFLKHGLEYAENCSSLSFWFEMISKYSAAGGQYGLKSIYETMLLDILLTLTPNSKMNADFDKLDIQINAFIEENLWEDITIEKLCNFTKMSKRSLFYYFKKTFNATPIQYVNLKKLRAAAGYLQMGFPVKNVAQMITDKDPSSFSRMFKNYYGVSPAYYVKSITTSSSYSS